MGRHTLLTADERRALYAVPTDRDDLARHHLLGPADLDRVAPRHGDANRLGFALQLALLRHPGLPLAHARMLPWVDLGPLAAFLALQLDIDPARLAGYGHRGQTLSDHARAAAASLGLRLPALPDLPMLLEVAAQAAWATDKGATIAAAMVAALREARIALPPPATLERVGVTGRALARKRAHGAVLEGLTPGQLARLDGLLDVDPATGETRLTWLRSVPAAPRPDHVRAILDRLAAVRGLAIDPALAARVHPGRLAQLAREGRLTPPYLLARYTVARRRATLAALAVDLEARLADAALDMADRLVGGAFARARGAQARQHAATARDVGRLMRLFQDTIDALADAAESDTDALEAVDGAVGLARLMTARPEMAAIAGSADADPLLRAADRHPGLRRFAPALLAALDFRAARPGDKTLAAVRLLREMNASGRRAVPPDAPMPFRRAWHALVRDGDGRVDRRLYETAVLAHLRDKLRSGEVWVERSHGYRRFDSYLLPAAEAAPVTRDLGLPATADACLERRGKELDSRLKAFAAKLARGELDGVELRGGRLHVSPVRAATPPEAEALAARLEAMLPRVRVTELLHEAARGTGFLGAFTNLRTGEPCASPSALLAAILADATNLGLSRMAEASQGVTRDQLFWTADAFVREETYKAALSRVIDAHRALPIAAAWGDGTTSSSDGQFFRSGKRGAGAGEVNARHGGDPGLAFYTHVSDQHGPYHVRVISAMAHEAPYVLDGLLHHGTGLRVLEHYTDTGGATDALHGLCAMLGFRFCPRLRDLPDRRLAPLADPARYPGLAPLLGRRVRVDVVREHWDEVLRLVASLKSGHALPSAMLRKLSAHGRQHRLDLALQEVGKIERTLFTLDWLESAELRRRCHAGLNKGEQRHALAQAICTFRQGRVADRSHEAQQYRASGLNLVVAAVVWWNSTYMADAVARLRAAGEAVPDDLLAHTSPVTWEHVAFSGDFLWDRAAALPDGRRQLRLTRAGVLAA